MAEAKVPDEVAFDPYKLLLYKKALRKGKERENTLRVNIIGNYAQGKSSLAKRLIGKTCEKVTTTNGIEINRYKCQTSPDGTHILTSSENESHEFVNRLATIARSIEPTIKSEIQETHLEECLTHDYSELATIENKTQPIETNPYVAEETFVSKVDYWDDISRHALPQRLKIKEGKRMTLSAEEMALFSNIVEEEKYTSEKFIDIWDFGGQYIFYATHTLFHSRRALYLLVFDLTKNLETIVLDEEYPGETGDRNMEYFARFWIESIHSYVGPDPQIVLVGTHKDELKGNDRLWKKYFEKVRCLFDGTDLIYHIQKEDFAVDNYDISDPGIADLLSFILKKHTELVQPVEIPARWIQLEKALRALKTSIITFQDVVELDKKNTHPLLDEEQLKLFLHYHHEKGTLFFYDEGVISDFVCLDPQFLIDAFKCIITSEQFYKNDPDIRSLWKVLSKEGRLTRQLIDKVWINQPDMMKHKDVLLRFLTKQNIIAEVVEYNVNSEEKKQKDWFIVPSLLKDHSSKEEMLRFLSGKTQSQVRYSMKFAKSSVVHLVFNKALAAAVGTWPVVKFGTKLLLFENVCVLKLIRNHAGLLEQRKDSGTIELKVVHLLSKQIECHPTDEFRRFVESIVLHEFGRLGYPERGRSKPFVPAYRCNHAYHGPGGSSQLTHFKEDEDVICPDNVTHDSFDNIRAKAEWSYENTIDEVYPKMQLTEKTLSKLAQCAIGSNWCLLGPQLKIKKAEIDHIEEEIKQVEMKIYTMLQKWKDRCASNATLDQLVEAIKKCPGVSIYWDEIRNIRDEYLRKQRKQEIDLIRPLSNKIVKIHETLTLECDITKSNVSVTWLKDGEPITPDSRTLISSNGGFHQLVVKDITMNDDAKYTCVYGNCITECFVKVEDTFWPLQFIKELSDIEVGDIPSTVTFLCELNTSQTEVEWYYRNQRLYPSNKYTIIEEGSVHILKIKDVSETDEGKYSVLANGLRSEATLYVEETEEERFLLAQHRRQRAEQLKSVTNLRSDSNVTGTETTANAHVWSVDCMQSYSIKTDGDRTGCYMTGCCMLPTGEIVLSDSNNCRLKKLNGRYQVIGVCDLPGRAWGVCYCGNNEAVLAMSEKNLQFVDVRESMLLTRKVKTSHSCNGINCHGNQLYVVDEKSVYLYSIDGRRQRLLYTHQSDFRHIAVSDNGNNIYIADYDTGLHSIDSSGSHLYTFTDSELSGARAVCLDDNGHVLVCGAWSAKVLQISSDGKQKLGIIPVCNNDTFDIRTLYFDRRNATLITAGHSEKIAVLKLKQSIIT